MAGVAVMAGAGAEQADVDTSISAIERIDTFKSPQFIVAAEASGALRSHPILPDKKTG